MADTFEFHCTMHRVKVWWSVSWRLYRWELPGSHHWMFGNGQLWLVVGTAWWENRHQVLTPCLLTLSEAIAFSFGWHARAYGLEYYPDQTQKGEEAAGQEEPGGRAVSESGPSVPTQTDPKPG